LGIQGLGTGRVDAAGEPIQFAPGRSKVAPDLQNSLSQEKASVAVRGPKLVNLHRPDMVERRDGVTRNRREEKKAKNADLEKKNWLILKQGELQEKDDEGTELGVRNDSIEKERTVGEIWFSPDRSDRSKAQYADADHDVPGDCWNASGS